MDLANTVNTVNSVNSVNLVNPVKQTWADIVKPKETIELTENYDTKIEPLPQDVERVLTTK